jgi:hypothetical protein
MHVEVPNEDGTVWTKIENKEEVEIHLIDRNVEQFSHAGNTPFGYTDLGKISDTQVTATWRRIS